MKIACPHCGVKGTLADSFIHKDIRCPRCQKIFRAEVEVEFMPVEEIASPPPTPPPVPPRPAPPRPMGEMGQRPQRVVVPPNAKLNVQPLGAIPQEAAPVEVNALYSGEVGAVVPPAAPQESPQTQPQSAPPIPSAAKPPDLAEEQAPADLGALFARKSLCAGCGRQANDNEDFALGQTGLLCPACRAAAEPVDKLSPPIPAKSAIDWGAAQTASDWRLEDELRKMAVGGKRPVADPKTHFTAFPILQEAWTKLKGVKGDVWGAAAIIILLNLIFGAVVHFLPNMKTEPGIIGLAVVGITAFFLNGLLLSGLGYLGLCQARGEESGWDLMFVSFSPANLAKLPLLFILLFIIVGLGIVCLIIPGIYLAVTLSFSPLLVLDKGMSPWKAMRESWKESHANCLNIFLLYLAFKVAFWAAALCLLVGLFWMLPFVFVAYGVIYRRLFDGA